MLQTVKELVCQLVEVRKDKIIDDYNRYMKIKNKDGEDILHDKNIKIWINDNYMLANGNKERKILLNSWEGVYFDINQKGMDQMMNDISSMGGELFVMDDGWFGDKYPRKTDNSSLGDWVVDKNKLPEGIEGLLRDAKKHGIKFDRKEIYCI